MRVPTDVMEELVRVESAEARAPGYQWNDNGTGRALLDYFGRDLLAIRDARADDAWAFWTGREWSLRPHHRLVAEFHRAVAQPMVRVAAAQENDALAKWALSCGNYGKATAGIRSAHATAQTDEYDQVISLDEFDRAPELLGVANGILDLRGEKPVLIPRSRDLLVTKSTPCEYHPDATHPALDSYLDAFLPEPDMREFVQRVLGYAALRDGNSERRMFWFKGGTSTGKSAIVDWVHHTLGGHYSMSTDPALFREKREQGATSELHEALDRRFLALSEFGSSTTLHASILKRLTGSDSIQARKAHVGDPSERIPAFTPVVSTNEIPRIDNPDEGLQRRLVVVPFLHASDPNERDKREVLNPETWPAVLAWLAGGYAAYKREGLGPDTWPGAVARETERTFGDLSPGDQFWAECVEEVEGERVLPADMVKAFFKWQAQEDVPEEVRLTKSKFQQFVNQQKKRRPDKRWERIGPGERKAVKFHIGVRLKPEKDWG